VRVADARLLPLLLTLLLLLLADIPPAEIHPDGRLGPGGRRRAGGEQGDGGNDDQRAHVGIPFQTVQSLWRKSAIARPALRISPQRTETG
jgi:hypothetical protein